MVLMVRRLRAIGLCGGSRETTGSAKLAPGLVRQSETSQQTKHRLAEEHHEAADLHQPSR